MSGLGVGKSRIPVICVAEACLREDGSEATQDALSSHHMGVQICEKAS